MKIALTILVIVLAVLSCGCTTTAPATPAATPTATATPDLLGVWTGTTVGYINNLGFVDQGTMEFNITLQKGHVFAGHKVYTWVLKDGSQQSEEFSGVINARGEISIAELESGTVIGDLIGPDTMELSFIDDGPEAKAFITTLHRQKS